MSYRNAESVANILLSATGLHKAFGPKQVLSDVNLELPRGSITALLGRSGAGKTTLLRTVALLEEPDGGEICVLGDTRRFPASGGETKLRPIWPRLTVVFQDLFLWPHLTCFANIALAAKIANPSRGDDLARSIAQDLQLDEILNRRPANVSRGQRQLVALARALVLEPQILLVDEITASLDVESSALVAAALSTLRSGGAAVMLITHQYGFARKQANNFIYMHDGKVEDSGPASALDDSNSPLVRRYVEQALLAP